MPLHVFVVHFPLALILVGAAGDLVGAGLQSDRIRTWAGSLLILGSAAALLAFLTGAGAESAALSMPQPDRSLIETHSQWGGAAIWPVVGAGVLRVMWRRQLQGPHGWATLAAGVLSAALVIGISASGVAISHG
jgi:uncharacterized membrane protein